MLHEIRCYRILHHEGPDGTALDAVNLLKFIRTPGIGDSTKLLALEKAMLNLGRVIEVPILGEPVPFSAANPPKDLIAYFSLVIRKGR